METLQLMSALKNAETALATAEARLNEALALAVAFDRETGETDVEQAINETLARIDDATEVLALRAIADVEDAK